MFAQGAFKTRTPEGDVEGESGDAAVMAVKPDVVASWVVAEGCDALFELCRLEGERRNRRREDIVGDTLGRRSEFRWSRSFWY